MKRPSLAQQAEETKKAKAEAERAAKIAKVADKVDWRAELGVKPGADGNEPPPNAADADTPEEGKRAIRPAHVEAAALLQTTGMPSPPKVVMQVDQELRQEEPNIAHIVELVGKDASMAARLIRVINSPANGLCVVVRSIGHALTLLGLRKFKTMVLATALREQLSGKEVTPEFEHYWSHGIFTARTCEWLAQRVEARVTPDMAHLLGLFHNCGIALMLRKFPKYLDLYDVRRVAGGKQVLAIENHHCRTNHCAVGYLVAKVWNLPEEICQALLFHHHPELPEKVADQPKILRMWALLRYALCLVEYLHWRQEEEREEQVFVYEGLPLEQFLTTDLLSPIELSLEDFHVHVSQVIPLCEHWGKL